METSEEALNRIPATRSPGLVARRSSCLQNGDPPSRHVKVHLPRFRGIYTQTWPRFRVPLGPATLVPSSVAGTLNPSRSPTVSTVEDRSILFRCSLNATPGPPSSFYFYSGHGFARVCSLGGPSRDAARIFPSYLLHCAEPSTLSTVTVCSVTSVASLVLVPWCFDGKLRSQLLRGRLSRLMPESEVSPLGLRMWENMCVGRS